jgi:hypothetical protein
LDQINQYLNQGGRLLAMFNALDDNRSVGLEKVLSRWGVTVSETRVKDIENATDPRGLDVKVSDFGTKPHPVVNPLVNLYMHLVLPRSVGASQANDHPPDAPSVTEIAFTSEHAVIGPAESQKTGRFPLAVAVERGMVKGVITERGSTRMLVVGDSNFLGNQMIESAGNREFAHAVLNWLLDRPQLIEGMGARPINEYRITMTQSQSRNVRWILLAAMPGGLLLLGGLVWLRRRK